ncbi:MAG: hypothetical protein LBK73_12225 [Treponema sp.]|jgi:bacteriorhodopsin|nr:hypothetical protein [Treponema sp.]
MIKTVARELLVYAFCVIITFAVLAVLERCEAGKYSYYVCGMAAMGVISILSRVVREIK